MKWMLLLGVMFLAVVLGGIAALLGGWVAVVLVVPLIPMLLVLRDYRVGVVFMLLILPFINSPLLPQARGFNIFNYVLLTTFLVFMVGRLFGRKEIAWPPRVVWIGMLIPMCVGLLLAWGHLGEAQRNYVLADAALQYEPVSFLKARFIKPMTVVVFALLLANAVRDSRRPGLFIIPFAVSAMGCVLAIVALIAKLGINLSVLQSHREFLAPTGGHANEWGMLFAAASGPLLFLAADLRGNKRVAALMALGVVLLGLLLTFSRGGYLAFLIVLAVFLINRRQLRVLIVATFVFAAIAIFGPQAMRERATTGLDQSTLAEARSGSTNEALTAGRIGIYYMLVPEVLRSPIWGRGTGSTAWSNPVSRGQYSAGHPHNLYLEMLLDLGLIGMVAITYFYWRSLRAMQLLSRSDELSPALRSYFAGAAAALIGMLIMGMGNGYWLPHFSQAFFWFSIGMTLAYWPLAEKLRQGQRELSKAAALPNERTMLTRRPFVGWRPR